MNPVTTYFTSHIIERNAAIAALVDFPPKTCLQKSAECLMSTAAISTWQILPFAVSEP